MAVASARSQLLESGQARRAIALLLVLSSGIPEFLTGSTAIARLVVDPFGFAVGVAFLLGLYGAGAVLIREAAVRLGKGWASILAWGVAYGILEEGVAVHTFFQASGPPVGLLGRYGHLLGVNWVWAVGLAAFHSLFSIALPILLTELWFPRVRGHTLLRFPGITLATGAFIVDVVVLTRLTPNAPSAALYAGALLATVLCMAGGAALPRTALRSAPGPPRIGHRGFVLLGVVPFTAWVAIGYLLSALGLVPAWATIGLFLLAEVAVVIGICRWTGTQERDRTQYDFAVGLLLPLFVWDIVLEFSGSVGILVVTALAIAFLARLGRRLGRRSVAGGPPPGATLERRE